MRAGSPARDLDDSHAASASTSPDDLQWRLTVGPESIRRPAPGDDQRNVTLAFSVSCRDHEGAGHADAFDIDAATGQVLTRVGQTYARAAQARYHMIVTVADGTVDSDGASRTDTVPVTIEVESQSRPPGRSRRRL